MFSKCYISDTDPSLPPTPTPLTVSAPHLSRHMHEQHCSDRSLGLAVSLIRPIDGVGFQDPVQVLLPAGTNTKIIQWTNPLKYLTTCCAPPFNS